MTRTVIALTLSAIGLTMPTSAQAAQINMRSVRISAYYWAEDIKDNIRDDGARRVRGGASNCYRLTYRRARCDAWFTFRTHGTTASCSMVLRFRKEYGSSRIIRYLDPDETDC